MPPLRHTVSVRKNSSNFHDSFHAQNEGSRSKIIGPKVLPASCPSSKSSFSLTCYCMWVSFLVWGLTSQHTTRKCVTTLRISIIKLGDDFSNLVVNRIKLRESRKAVEPALYSLHAIQGLGVGHIYSPVVAGMLFTRTEVLLLACFPSARSKVLLFMHHTLTFAIAGARNWKSLSGYLGQLQWWVHKGNYL